jgi:hypothetical protein
VFDENQCRIRKDHAPQNMAIVRHFQCPEPGKTEVQKHQHQGLRKKAGWGNATLRTILDQVF